MSTQPKPLNYAFPNFIPGRHRIPPNFKLFPEAFFPELKAASLPSTPPIPPTVATGDIITAGHENTVTTAINDLWTNEQWIAANMLADPTTATGDIVVRGSGGLTKLPVGGNGQILTADSTVTALGVKWAALSAASVGAVPTSFQVIAGAGMGGGGAMTGTSVTLTANVLTVFGRTGAIVLTAAEVMKASGASHALGVVPDPGAAAGTTRFLREDATWAALSAASLGAVPTTTQVIAGAGMTGGGALSGNVTLNAAVVSVFGRTGAIVFTAAEVMGASGASHAAGIVPDPGAAAGATHYLREDGTWAIPAGQGGGLTDPTTTAGDLIVRGTSAVTRLGVGITNGMVLTVDSTATPLGIKWATPTGGGGTPAGAAGDVQFNSAGAFAADTGRFVWDAANHRLGIGVASPAYPLHVAAPAAASAVLFGDPAGPNTFDFMAASSGNNCVISVNLTWAGAWALRNAAYEGWAISQQVSTGTSGSVSVLHTPVGGSAPATHLMINSAGWVGIGVNPQAPLHIVKQPLGSSPFCTVLVEPGVGASYCAIGVRSTQLSTTQTWFFGCGSSGANNNFRVYDLTNSIEAFNIAPGGNVSIGFNAPAYKLDVRGDVNIATGNVYRINGVPLAAANVVNAVDQTQSYANPAWITSLPYSKITGAPAGGAQTPWASDIDAASHMLSNASAIGVGTGANTAWPLWLVINSASSTGQAQMWNKASGGASGFLLATEGGTNAGGIMFCGSAYAAPTWSSTLFVYTQGANDIGFGTQNVERMRITKTGLVGIGNDGTIPPTTPGGAVEYLLGQNTVGGALGRTTVAANTTNVSTPVGVYAFANFNISGTEKRIAQIVGFTDGALNSGAIAFNVFNAGSYVEVMRCTSTGRVGIGVVAPLYTFQVHAAANENLGIGPAISISGAVALSAGNDANSANTPLEIRASPIVFMVGNVGIGMNPSYPLDVNGGVRCSGAFFCNSSITATQNVYASGSVLASGVASTFGTASGSSSAPTTANTNILLYNSSTTNWAGIGADGAGNMYFKVGTSGSPPAALQIVASSGQMCAVPPANASAPSITGQIAVCEATNNAAYRMILGYFLDGATSVFKGYIQTYQANAVNALCLNPNGGNVGVNMIAPNTALTVNGVVSIYGPSQSYLRFESAAQASGWMIGRSVNNNDANDFFIYNQASSNIVVSIVNNNLAINTTNTTARFTVSTTGYASPVAGQNHASVYFTPGGWGLQIGHYPAGDTWFQSQRDDANGSLYNILLQPIGGGVGIGMQSGPSYNLQLANDSAGKPSANWTVTSDVRTKRNIRPYLEGLNTLLQLHPTVFEYNGEAETPEGLERVGLVAQDVADVIPGCVQKIVAHIRGEETEVLALNTSDLQWMMLNALREIDARLREANL